jgi:hypothetical protein
MVLSSGSFLAIHQLLSQLAGPEIPTTENKKGHPCGTAFNLFRLALIILLFVQLR